MNVDEIMQCTNSLGTVFFIDGDKLRYKTLQHLPENLKVRIRENKEEIVQWLRDRPTTPLDINEKGAGAGPGTQGYVAPHAAPLSGPYGDVRSSLMSSQPGSRQYLDNAVQQDVIKPKALTCFEIGHRWLREHLSDLLARGWTRRELFGRGLHTWPYGNWGVAWLPTWSDSAKLPSIGSQGEVEFTFEGHDQQLQHTAWPNASNPAIKRLGSSVSSR